MGTFSVRYQTLPDGTRLRLRSPELKDAAAILTYRYYTLGTHDFEVLEMDELRDNLQSQQQWVKRHIDEENSLCLLAEVFPQGRPELVGMADFLGYNRRRLAHHGTLGLGVAPAWRDRGIGRSLLAAVIDWVRLHPILEKIFLGVWANNERALHLYHSLGFREEGRHLDFFRPCPGVYIDDVIMGLHVKRVESSPKSATAPAFDEEHRHHR